MSHFSPICPPFLHHFPPFFFLVGTVSYIFHDVFVTTSHFPPFFSIVPHFPPFSLISPHFPSFPLIFPHFPHASHFSVACWILGYSGYGYFLGLQVQSLPYGAHCPDVNLHRSSFPLLFALEWVQSGSSWEVAMLNMVPKVPPAPSLSPPELGLTSPLMHSSK